MASEGELDHTAAIRNLLTNIQAGSGANSGGTNDCVAQLLAAAVAQFGNSPTVFSTSEVTVQDPPSSTNSVEMLDNSNEGNFNINPEVAGGYEEGLGEIKNDAIENIVEVPNSVKRKPIVWAKFPVELRKRIIAMRKEGRKYVEVAKELNISVSGAQKVWERFLATGLVHDRKPSTYAGRPRKYPQLQDTPPTYGTSYDNEPAESPSRISGSGDIASADIAGTSTESDVIVTYTGNTDVFGEGPLDMPGATVEVVETDPQPASTSAASKDYKKGAPAYRQRLLLKLIQDCPLSTFREDLTLAADNPHVVNLSSSINKPLYMEYVLGHPFGKVPLPRPFDGDSEEAKVILSDPSNPVGKEMLANLGYSTKVYFNACCKPSPLFDQSKLLSSLPFSLGPGYLSETMQAVLQLLLDLCSDPVAAMERIPKGNGLALSAKTADGEYKSQRFNSPMKLSEYWTQLYAYASLLECCENFLSATKPSAPCLVCHSFEAVVKDLEIQDDVDDNVSILDNHSLAAEEKSQQVEVHVLQSGQINFAAGSKYVDADSSLHYGEESTARDVVPENRGHTDGGNCQQNLIHSEDSATNISSPLLDNCHQKLSSDGSQESSPVRTTCSDASKEVPVLVPQSSADTSFHAPLLPTPIAQAPQPSPFKEPPLIIRRNHPPKHQGTPAHQQASQSSVSPPGTNTTSPATMQKGVRRSSRLSLRTNNDDISTSPQSEGYNLRRKQTFSISASPPSAKRSRHSDSPRDKTATSELDHRSNDRNPLDWSIEEVVQFIANIPKCDYAQVFREHEVDGESLLTLDPEMMVKLMNIKAGPSLRIYNKIMQLKKHSFS